MIQAQMHICVHEETHIEVYRFQWLTGISIVVLDIHLLEIQNGQSYVGIVFEYASQGLVAYSELHKGLTSLKGTKAQCSARFGHLNKAGGSVENRKWR